MLPCGMIELREYADTTGKIPFAIWFEKLNAPAAAKITTALIRLEQGNFSNVKVLARECWNTGSTSDLVIAFISEKTESKSSFYWLVGARRSRIRTSRPPEFDGRITKGAKQRV